MIYIFESELSNEKSVFLALISIYGIGRTNSQLVCKKLGFSNNFKIKNLSNEQVDSLIKTIDSLNILISNDLRKFRLMILQKLISINSYKGFRRNKGLPVRGQRTHTNAKTAKKKFI